jgi:hypothetical protein
LKLNLHEDDSGLGRRTAITEWYVKSACCFYMSIRHEASSNAAKARVLSDVNAYALLLVLVIALAWVGALVVGVMVGEGSSTVGPVVIGAIVGEGSVSVGLSETRDVLVGAIVGEGGGGVMGAGVVTRGVGTGVTGAGLVGAIVGKGGGVMGA